MRALFTCAFNWELLNELGAYGTTTVERCEVIGLYKPPWYVTWRCVFFELWARYDFSRFEETLECGRFPASGSRD